MDLDGNIADITVDSERLPNRKVSRYFGKDSVGEPVPPFRRMRDTDMSAGTPGKIRGPFGNGP